MRRQAEAPPADLDLFPADDELARPALQPAGPAPPDPADLVLKDDSPPPAAAEARRSASSVARVAAIACVLGPLLGGWIGYEFATRRGAGGPGSGGTVSMPAPGPASMDSARVWSEGRIPEMPYAPAAAEPARGVAVAASGPVAAAPRASASGEPVAPAVEAASPAAPRAGGRLLIRSSPAGAEVLLDGVTRGSTPLAVRDLPWGAHEVVVTLPGSPPETRRFQLTPARPAASTIVDFAGVPGRPPSGPASLRIDSRPRGAQVTVDGRVVGTTPLSLPGIGAGRRVVRLERAGYEPWVTAVRLAPGQTRRVNASLERKVRP